MGPGVDAPLVRCETDFLSVECRRSWHQTPSKQEVAKMLGGTGAFFLKVKLFPWLSGCFPSAYYVPSTCTRHVVLMDQVGALREDAKREKTTHARAHTHTHTHLANLTGDRLPGSCLVSRKST